MAQRQCITSFPRFATQCSGVLRDGVYGRIFPRSRQIHTRVSPSTTHPSQRSQFRTTSRFPQRPASQYLSQHQFGRTRAFSSTNPNYHGDLTPPKPGEERHITFIDKEGQEHTFEVADGDNLLDIAQANDLEMEGACGGSCACSTCHVIVQDDDMYDKIEEPSDDENDMLDLAFGLTETSRLGCQVQMSKDLDGLVVKLPSMTRNMQASDFAEKEKK